MAGKKFRIPEDLSPEGKQLLDRINDRIDGRGRPFPCLYSRRNRVPKKLYLSDLPRPRTACVGVEQVVSSRR